MKVNIAKMIRRLLPLLAVLLWLSLVVQPASADTWAIGQIVGLCKGTQIRTGPGFGYNAHTTVPENDWAVKIIDGPRSADGEEWWDTSRKAAGDPSGGTGWVYRREATACKNPPPPAATATQPPSPGNLVIVEALSLSSTSPDVNGQITARFRLQNNGGQPLSMQRLNASARGPGARSQGWNAREVDFPSVQNLTLQPGQTFTYQQSRSFDPPGDYFAEPTFQDTSGNWNGIPPFTRVYFDVSAPQAPSPTPPPPTAIPQASPTPVPPTDTPTQPSVPAVVPTNTSTPGISFGCAGFGRCPTPTAAPSPAIPPVVKITDFTFADAMTNPSHLDRPYVLRANILWVKLTNVGQSSFGPGPNASKFTIQLVHKRAGGKIMERTFTPSNSRMLEPLPSLAPGESRWLAAENVFFYVAEPNGQMEVFLDPDPSLRIGNSILVKDIPVDPNPDTICACAATLANAAIKVLQAEAAADTAGASTVFDYADLSTSLSKEVCGNKSATEKVTACSYVIVKWFADQLLKFSNGAKFFSLSLDILKEMGEPPACIKVAEFMNAVMSEGLRWHLSGSSILTESPVYPLASNKAGQRAGFLENGQTLTEISGSQTTLLGEKRIIVFPGSDSVEVKISGYAAGSMDLHAVFAVSNDTSTALTYQGVQVAQGMKAALSSTDQMHHLAIDSKGDGSTRQDRVPDQVQEFTSSTGTGGNTPAPGSSNNSNPVPSRAVDGVSGWLPVILFVLLASGAAFFVVQASGRPAAAGARPRLQLASGRASRRSIELSNGSVLVGRYRRATLVVDDPQASQQHARISRAPDGYVLQDLQSSNGTFVNDQRITHHLLRSGDRIRIGRTEFVYIPPGSAHMVAPGTSAPAGIQVGGARGRFVPMRGSAMTIGRSHDCDVILDEKMASHTHARVIRNPDGYVVEDLGSTNGTSLNGRRITSARLADGDEIRVGHAKLIFRMRQ